MTTTHLLYLHGFRSSPQSAKAQRLQQHIALHHPHIVWSAPQLPPSPQEAADLLLATTRNWAGLPPENLAVVGSSLGGFYASWIAQQLRCKSVLINPSTTPWVTLAQHLGEQTAWHNPDESFFFKPEYLQQLQALDVSGQPPAAAQLLIAAMGDEVLHWQDMVARYPSAQLLLDEGSDHALSNFENYLPQLDTFLAG